MSRFDIHDAGAFRSKHRRWCDGHIALVETQADSMAIEKHEQAHLLQALHRLRYNVDELIQIIDKGLCTHDRDRALSHLYGIIGPAVTVGGRGVDNPITEKFLNDRLAKGRNTIPRIRDRGLIQKVVNRYCAKLWKKKPMFVGNQLGTSKELFKNGGVNAMLKRLRIEPPLTEGALYHQVKIAMPRKKKPAGVTRRG
jgi:hypothetical protein